MPKRVPYLRRRSTPTSRNEDVGERAGVDLEAQPESAVRSGWSTTTRSLRWLAGIPTAHLTAVVALVGALIGVVGASIPAIIQANASKEVAAESYLRDKRLSAYTEMFAAVDEYIEPKGSTDANRIFRAVNGVELLGTDLAYNKSLDLAKEMEDYMAKCPKGSVVGNLPCASLYVGVMISRGNLVDQARADLGSDR